MERQINSKNVKMKSLREKTENFYSSMFLPVPLSAYTFLVVVCDRKQNFEKSWQLMSKTYTKTELKKEVENIKTFSFLSPMAKILILTPQKFNHYFKLKGSVGNLQIISNRIKN